MKPGGNSVAYAASQHCTMTLGMRPMAASGIINFNDKWLSPIA